MIGSDGLKITLGLKGETQNFNAVIGTENTQSGARQVTLSSVEGLENGSVFRQISQFHSVRFRTYNQSYFKIDSHRFLILDLKKLEKSYCKVKKTAAVAPME